MPEEFVLFISSYPASIQLIAQRLRQIIASELPGTREMVDAPSRIIAYGAGANYADLVCAIAPYSKYVNLMFSHGASMPDPDRILKGTGKKARHIRVEIMTEQLEGQIRKYLKMSFYDRK